MKKQLLLLVTLLTLTACSFIPISIALPSLGERSTPLPPPKIDRQPLPAYARRGTLTSVLHYDPMSDKMWQVDLRSYNLSKLDLSTSLTE